MCQVSLIQLGCGHKIFGGVLQPCPSEVCPRHGFCYADRTRVVRVVQMQQPPFCAKCLEKEKSKIEARHDHNVQQIVSNIVEVRDYFRARYGELLDEDIARIFNRLHKIKRLQLKALQDRFFEGRPENMGDYRWVQKGHWMSRASRRAHEHCTPPHADDSSDEDTVDNEPERLERQAALTVGTHVIEDDSDVEETSDYIQLIRSGLQDRRNRSANHSTLQEQRDQQLRSTTRAIEEIEDIVADSDTAAADMHRALREHREREESILRRFAEGTEDEISEVDPDEDAEFEPQSLRAWEERQAELPRRGNRIAFSFGGIAGDEFRIRGAATRHS
ncbi:MAG: hypothetical protein Q9183_006498 [Haloplaca sp. 2 TL-2023]